MANNNEKNTRSLFLYTGLIFLVALIMIILSFFGQSHLSNKQPTVETPAPESGSVGIVQNAAILSEENTKLMQQNTELQNQITQLQGVIDAKTSENSRLLKENAVSESLLAAKAYYSAGNIEKAAEMLASIDTTAMTNDQALFYDELNQLINGGTN